MSLRDLIKDYDYTTKDCLLKETTEELSIFKVNELQGMLEDMYSHKKANIKMMASVINAIFTHHAQTFLLTKKSLIALIKQDSLQKKTNISGQEYKLFYHVLTTNGHFETLREATSNKSGVYKLVEAEMVESLHKLHSTDWFNNQEKKVVDYYDESTKEKPELSMRELAVRDGVL